MGGIKGDGANWSRTLGPNGQAVRFDFNLANNRRNPLDYVDMREASGRALCVRDIGK